MKITRKLVVLLLLVFLFPVVSMGETVDRTELVTRDNLYYEKFTDVAFTGTVTGKEQGEVVEGKKVGVWLNFYESGQLYSRSIYSEPNVYSGEYSEYYENGCLRVKGQYVDNNRDGLFGMFHENCKVQIAGKFDKGKKVGEWVSLYDSELVFVKGVFNEKGERHGNWFLYSKSGEVRGQISYNKGEIVSKKGSKSVLLNLEVSFSGIR